jgi:hypothetical protein
MTMHDNFIDITDTGAVGDGKTDCSQAIQKALDQAADTGATVQVPAGTFLCSDIKVPPQVGLQGYPTWSFRRFGGSIFKLNNAKARCLLDLTGAIGTTLNGLCLDGGELPGHTHGVMIDKPDYGSEEDAWRIERCRISRFSGDGIHLGRIWCFSIRHSMISHNKGNGILVRGWDGFILDNWLSGNDKAGLGAYDENSSTTVTGNRIEWNHSGGILLHGSGNYNLTGNYIDRSGGPAIALLSRDQHPCRTITVTGNVIYRSGAPQWHDLAEEDDVHLRFESVKGLTCTGNAMQVGRNDKAAGEWSPAVCMRVKDLEDAIIKDNVMHNGALKDLILDLGGHGQGVIIKDNVGCTCSPPQ